MARVNATGFLLALLVCGVSEGADTEQLTAWGIERSTKGWRLLRDGKPFYIKGAVGWNRFDVLRQCGGNAVRTRASQTSLDRAHQAGLVALANLPVRGERNAMDWGDDEAVERQRQRVLDVVRRLKGHPPVMC